MNISKTTAGLFVSLLIVVTIFCGVGWLKADHPSVPSTVLSSDSNTNAMQPVNAVPDAVVSQSQKVGSADTSQTPADARVMIQATYNTYISQMKSYVDKTYPPAVTASLGQQYAQLEESNPEVNIQIPLNPIVTEYHNLTSTMSDDLTKQITLYTKNFCDFNESISTPDEQSYCHTTFNVENIIAEVQAG